MTNAAESQPERTALAWTRTSFAVLANGAVLLLRTTQSGVGPLHLVGAALAALLAASTYLLGVRRQRILAQRPLPEQISPRREVFLTGASVIGLISISLLAVAL